MQQCDENLHNSSSSSRELSTRAKPVACPKNSDLAIVRKSEVMYRIQSYEGVSRQQTLHCPRVHTTKSFTLA